MAKYLLKIIDVAYAHMSGIIIDIILDSFTMHGFIHPFVGFGYWCIFINKCKCFAVILGVSILEHCVKEPVSTQEFSKDESILGNAKRIIVLSTCTQI